MDETRRFIRYVTPGLIFPVETVLLLLVLQPGWTGYQIHEFKGDSAIGVVLATLLASGGLGFLFSVVHHFLHWRSRRYRAIDHSPVVTSLAQRGIIELRDIKSGQTLTSPTIPPRDAWVIVTVLWHQRTKCSREIGAAEKRAVGLVDLVHSMGTATIASLCSLVAALAVAASIASFALTMESVARFLATISLAILIVVLLHKSYTRTGRFAQQFVEEVLADALISERTKGPIVTHIAAP